jgi:signal transduction histidine kinase
MSAAIAPRPTRWPWSIFAGFLITAGLASIFVVRNGESFGEQVPYIVAFSMFGAVGALIVSRESRNRIGLLLLWASGITALSFASQEIATYLIRRGDHGFLVGAIAVFGSAGWLFGILPAIFLLPILFPTGRPHSPRWRALPWIVLGMLGFLAIGVIFGSRMLTDANDVELMRNPLYIPVLDEFGGPIWNFPGWFPLLLISSGVSQVMRFVASKGVERQQIKWFAFAIVVFVAYLVVSDLAHFSGLAESIASGVSFLLLPIAIGVSILQFRLWDLDVVVKKAVVAGLLVVFALAVYAGAVALVGIFASDRESTVTLFLVALALGIAFRPVMRSARHVVDRLVYGERATPYEVLTEFSERVGTSYATEDVLPRMAQVLGEGSGAEVARVWLRSGRRLLQAAVWPADATLHDPIPVSGDAVLGPHGETTAGVRDRGELLGALSVRMSAADPMNPAKEKLVRDLAAQAGLVLRNVRLVEDLRASRQRLVAAQDEERRRLERNIHDGAQQQLVALAVKARLARQLTERDPAKTAEMLHQIEAETQTALEDLRDLARGIYPPLLADRGLVAALEAQSRKASVPVSVEADAVGRYSADVEATVYFCTLEALQNVAKYAEADGTVIRLSQSNGSLTFEVVDEGRGFDPDAVATGTGLQGMADRLAAVGGSLEIRSAPGRGTTVAGRVPVTAA